MIESNWGKLGRAAGVLTFILSLGFMISWGVRYLFVYEDINIAILGVLIGALGIICSILIIGLSWMYNQNKMRIVDLEKTNQTLTAFEDKVTEFLEAK